MDITNKIEEVSWLHVTERAAMELSSYAESNEETGKIISLVSMGFGWGGPRLGLVESEKSSADILIQADDLIFAINDDITKTVAIYGDVIIDYVKTIYQKGFSIKFDRSRGC